MHFLELIQEWEELKQARAPTYQQITHFDQGMHEQQAFTVALDTAQQVKQALDRATDWERLGDVWAIHMATVPLLPTG